MAEIRLDNVSKVFRAGSLGGDLIARRQMLTSQGFTQGTPPAVQEGDVRALDGVDLVVPDGTTVVIVGPSGCGKSTLLRAVAGLTDYTGLIAYDDRDMADVPVKERRIGMVFQSYALYPHFYGQGNLSFFFQMNRAPDAEAEERIRITSEMMGFGFKELLKRKPGTLSGGQQQRLAIARALVREPDLFLFDEPLSNLDAKLRARTRTEIKRLLHRFSVSAIYVTHDQTEAMALADRVAVMRAGRIEQIGTFHEILDNPVNAFVAGFLGLPPMNLIPGRIEDDRLWLGGEHRLPIPQPLLSAAQEHSPAAGREIIIGIRPERIQVLADGVRPTASGPSLVGTVDVVEPDFGRHQQTAYLSAGQGLSTTLTFALTVPLDVTVAQGYQVTVHFPEDALFFFDGASEARIYTRQIDAAGNDVA